MKRALIFLLFIGFALKLNAQNRQIQGIVFDRDTKQRLARVYIYNLRTHKGFYNNSKGEFTTNTAQKGDTLIAALQGYRVDTLTVQSSSSLIFYLKRLSILLQEVRVNDTLANPNRQRAENQEAYKDAYRKGSPGDILRVGGTNGAGVGLSVDALWSMLSKEGKNARYLQQILERDYREMMIDYRYTKGLVNSVTGLTGAKLSDFMQQYRPSYYMVFNENDYELIAYIKASYIKFQSNPAANRLPSLKGNTP